MTLLSQLSHCDLHVHIGGSFYAEDFLALGMKYYKRVDWHDREFVAEYNQVFNTNLDPMALFETAVSFPHTALAQLKKQYIYDNEDNGHFDRFMYKYRFFQRIWSYGWEKDETAVKQMIQQMLAQHHAQGIDYIEYRAGFWGEPEQQIERFHICAEALQNGGESAPTAKLILNVPRDDSLARYEVIRTCLAQCPHLYGTIIGIDFAGIEEGFLPKMARSFFKRLHRDNQQNPQFALKATYHVGETFFDKSLESAIRWCHEASELGASRLGHCIALGLQSDVALSRRPQAHEQELVSERLDQIRYDLRFEKQLLAYNIDVNQKRLLDEQEALQKMAEDEVVKRPYSPCRLQEIHNRQQFVLDQISKMGTVIECCPTSNLRIGAVPDAAHHPIHRFLASNVNLVICTDDPGIFDISLASEVDWVLENTEYTAVTLPQRLGNPRRFQLRNSENRN